VGQGFVTFRDQVGVRIAEGTLGAECGTAP